jgi:hypothetical protein
MIVVTTDDIKFQINKLKVFKMKFDRLGLQSMSTVTVPKVKKNNKKKMCVKLHYFLRIIIPLVKLDILSSCCYLIDLLINSITNLKNKKNKLTPYIYQLSSFVFLHIYNILKLTLKKLWGCGNNLKKNIQR